MSTSFRPSDFDKQAAASLDMLDEQAAAERVQRILHPEPQGARSQAQAGPTLTPQPQTQPQAPAPRKKRSDAGIPKGPKNLNERGWITKEQAAHLDALLRNVVAREADLRRAESDYQEYLDELTIKK